MILKDLISTSEFQKSFFRNLPENFDWQKTPLQVYSLNFVAKHIFTPLPLFQSTNNYVIHLKKGSIRQFIGKDYQEINAPALLVVLNETIQSLVSVSPDIEGHIIVLIEDITLSALFDNEEILNLFVIEPVLSLAVSESSWIHTVNKLLYDEVTRNLPNRKIAEGLLQGLLYYVLQLSESKRSLSRQQLLAIKFKQLIHKHYVEHKNISFYATQLFISENYLNRCVRSVFKKNSKELILEIIIIKAQLLLWDISKDIAEIGFELGIDDASYFARVFKKITNETPTAYRKRIMHDLS